MATKRWRWLGLGVPLTLYYQRELTMAANKEEVFCLRRSDLVGLFGGERLPQGGFAGPEPERVLALPQHFIPRYQAEDDPAFKQLIPYQLFSHADRFLVYQRGGGVGEGRLAGLFSVGIGGHINRADAEAGRLTPAAYQQALLRERTEELVNAEGIAGRFVGWINDDASAVGSVHLGAVHLGEVTNEAARHALQIRAHGEDIHLRGWWSAAEIEARRRDFELWAVLAVELARKR